MKFRRFFHLLLMGALILVLIPVEKAVQAQPFRPQDDQQHPEYAPGQIIVGFERGLTADVYAGQAAALAGQIQATVKKQAASAALLEVDPQTDLTALVEQVKGMPGVRYAELNYATPLGFDPPPSNNPPSSPPVDNEDSAKVKAKKQKKKLPTFANDLFSSWANGFVREHLVWASKAKSATVCLVDSGVDLNHPDLKGNVISGYDFVNDDPLADDDYGHGTAMAGIIAARVNDGIGPAGISNGKILAVKVLGPEGWGWIFDIYQGLEYCAGRADVKVINLSLGSSYPNATLYDGLVDAKMADKLIVAAAGNGSTDQWIYPAAWADPTVPRPGGFANTISSVVVSAGAVTLPDTDIWVDKNGNLVKDSGEVYGYPSGCAAPFSNYGRWVTMVAPGERLFTTVPVSYPSYYSYYLGLTGYAYISGTSPSTAVISAAAARAYSAAPSSTAGVIKNILATSGDAVVTANSQPNNPAFNPDWGYYQSFTFTVKGQTVRYGDYLDYDLDGYYDTILAPYCWPSGAAPFGAAQDTSTARRVNVARAMGRFGVIVQLQDALTGLPLVGATVTAKNQYNQTVATGYVDSFDSTTAYLLNLPAKDSFGSVYRYSIFVNKPGYTKGNQAINGNYQLSFTDGWTWYDNSLLSAGIPPIGKLSVVANYEYPYYYIREIDLSLFIYTPVPNRPGWIYIEAVGPSDPLTAMPNYYDGSNTFWDFPYARYNLTEVPGGRSIQSITVKTDKLPDFNNGGGYYIFLSSFNSWYLDWAWPVVRVWYGGAMRAIYLDRSTRPGCNNASNTWWRVDRINGVATPYNQGLCGIGDYPGNGGIWPWNAVSATGEQRPMIQLDQ